MKNLKNTFAWITLAIILMVGTTVSNAGIIITGSGADYQQCTEDNGILAEIAGIIITGSAPQFAGVMIADAPCRNGVMIAD